MLHDLEQRSEHIGQGVLGQGFAFRPAEVAAVVAVLVVAVGAELGDVAVVADVGKGDDEGPQAGHVLAGEVGVEGETVPGRGEAAEVELEGLNTGCVGGTDGVQEEGEGQVAEPGGHVAAALVEHVGNVVAGRVAGGGGFSGIPFLLEFLEFLLESHGRAGFQVLAEIGKGAGVVVEGAEDVGAVEDWGGLVVDLLGGGEDVDVEEVGAVGALGLVAHVGRQGRGHQKLLVYL